MGSRYLVMLILFVAAMLGPALLGRGGSPASQGPDTPGVPPEALHALRQGRYWRASRILEDYLALVPDPEPTTVLLAAQAEAGWGDWAEVERLLAGRGWLDTVAGGYGWSLLGRSRYALERWAESGEALARYLQLSTGSGERERGLAEARRGLALTGAGAAPAAVEAFDRAAALLPQLGDWIAIFAAEAAAAAGDTATVRARLAGTEPRLAREWGWRLRIQAFRNANDPAAAREAAEAAAEHLDTAAGRADAWLIIGELRLGEGDEAGARTAFRRAMAASPSSAAAVDAARRLSELGGLTPEDQLRIGRIYLRHGNLHRGIAGLSAYLDSGRGSALDRAQIRLELGRAYFGLGRYRDAERRLLALAEDAPSARIAAEALFLAGRAQYRQGRDDAGQATFLRTAERFPHQVAAAKALFLVADLSHDDGELDRAREFYRRTAAALPNLNEAGLALMRLGGMAFLAGDLEGAAAVFEEYRRLHPDGRRYQQATYWAAKAYGELGREALERERLEEVRRTDPLSWYGLRAAEVLGAGFHAIPLEPAPPEDRQVEGAVAAALVRLDLLRELGRDDAAAFEVDRLEDHFSRIDDALYALAESFNARGYTTTGIQLGWDIYRREGAWNPRLLRIIYPFPYRNLIVAEARERGLDPFFIAGLIRQESMFNADVHSPAGAIGLMQIMPRTGAGLARTLGVDRFSSALLERPEINIHLGIKYVADLLDRYDRRLTAVLAAYNAGPQRVTRWSQFPEYADEELFAERIPYAETRHYVKVVQQNALIYAALYGDTATAAPSRGD